MILIKQFIEKLKDKKVYNRLIKGITAKEFDEWADRINRNYWLKDGFIKRENKLYSIEPFRKVTKKMLQDLTILETELLWLISHHNYLNMTELEQMSERSYPTVRKNIDSLLSKGLIKKCGLYYRI
jgi:predicted transcriptional regulator